MNATLKQLRAFVALAETGTFTAAAKQDPDEQAAQAQLLRLVLESPELDVLEFGRERYELENIFMQLVQGE